MFTLYIITTENVPNFHHFLKQFLSSSGLFHPLLRLVTA